jgi:hypothetical protein
MGVLQVGPTHDPDLHNLPDAQHSADSAENDTVSCSPDENRGFMIWSPRISGGLQQGVFA